MTLGTDIGWSTKYNKLIPTEVGLLSATIGTLTQQLKVMTDDEIMAKYGFILIDETHERDIQTDMAIYMLKNLLLRQQNNTKCPFVVLMSATFDPEVFLKYFNLTLLENYIYCKGEAEGFDEIWDWNDGRIINDMARGAATVIEKIITENPNDDILKADILVFLPGQKEFSELSRYLEILNEKLAAKDLQFSPLQIEGEAVKSRNLDYQRIMSIPTSEHTVRIKGKNYTPRRRVISTTNVAETGLTLNNLKYVIDAGFNREVEYNPVLNISGLITKPAPRSRITQRMGRAGRKFRGVFYPLYPKYIHEKLPAQQLPQILTSDVSGDFLGIVTEQLKVKYTSNAHDLQFLTTDIDMVDPPSADMLSACLEKFYTLGLVSPMAPMYNPDISVLLSNPQIVAKAANRVTEQQFYDYRFGLTKLGAVANLMTGIKIESVRMILSGYYWNCSILDLITIAAYLAIDVRGLGIMVDNKPVDPDWRSVYRYGMPSHLVKGGLLQKFRLLVLDEFIHGAVLFNALRHAINSATNVFRDVPKWCEQHQLNYSLCMTFLRQREEYIELAMNVGLDVTSSTPWSIYRTPEAFMSTITRLKYCIYDGYRNNMLIKTDGVYKTLNGTTVSSPAIFTADEHKLVQSSINLKIEAMPTVVLYHELTLKDDRVKTGMYSIRCGRVSVMDGYISVDPDFCI
jgi:hypothetical protein